MHRRASRKSSLWEEMARHRGRHSGKTDLTGSHDVAVEEWAEAMRLRERVRALHRRRNVVAVGMYAQGLAQLVGLGNLPCAGCNNLCRHSSFGFSRSRRFLLDVLRGTRTLSGTLLAPGRCCSARHLCPCQYRLLGAPAKKVQGSEGCCPCTRGNGLSLAADLPAFHTAFREPATHRQPIRIMHHCMKWLRPVARRRTTRFTEGGV